MDNTIAKREGRVGFAGVWNGDVALSLLQAAPFRISGQTHIHFVPTDQAAQILVSSTERIPKTIEGWVSRLSPDDARDRKNAIKRLSWDGAEYKLTYRWKTYHGEEIWLQETGRRISGTGDTPDEIEGVITNISASERANEKTAYLATHDGLTGTANASAITKALDQLVALTKRQSGEGAFLRLRVKNIGNINEVYGFQTGDRVLTEIAHRLEHIIRTPDVVGRIGGSEFGLVLYGFTAKDVEAIAGRLFLLLEKSPVKTPHGGLHGEIAISSTQIRTQANSAREALAQTRIALAQAKPSQLSLYDDAMGSNNVSDFKITTEQDILDALNQRRILLAYQPIIYAKSKMLHHYECLLRLRREDGELISAGRFIMDAERLGLVHLLDRRALELASETLRQDPDIRLALNVSAGTIKDKVIAAEYISALKALGPSTDRVTLELTETLAVDDPATAAKFSNDVRSMGASFAVDDFGAGHTTFRNLMAIEADSVKIDGSLIEGIASDLNKQTFVRMMVDLARTFSVETVAEMVDSRADAAMLQRLGVDYFQGYMFGVPAVVPSWQKWVS